MTESTSRTLRLQIRCGDCNRTVEVSLPTDAEDLPRQLADQRWRLSSERHAVAERGAVEPICPVCEEARYRCPP